MSVDTELLMEEYFWKSCQIQTNNFSYRSYQKAAVTSRVIDLLFVILPRTSLIV